MPRFSVPKGTRDFEADQLYARRATGAKIMRVLERYGFQEASTPVFEEFEVFEAKSGPEIVELIYEFEDKGGRHLGLRPDFTPATARLIGPQVRGRAKPIKTSMFDRLWRYERPQSGRYREFYQINAEIYGSDDPLTDAELLACFCDCYDEVGLTDYQIRIGHRGLLENYVLSLGVSEANRAEVIRAIDKAPKLKESIFIEQVVTAGLPQASLDKLQAFMNTTGPFYEGVKQAISELSDAQAESLDTLLRIAQLTQDFEIADRCVLDLSIARGMDYYTGIIFECVYNTESVGSLGGGGRYDHLVEIYSSDGTPATGFAIGFDRVMVVLEELKLIESASYVPALDYYVLPVDDSCLSDAIRIAQALRAQDCTVELDHLRRSFSKQIRRADSMNAQRIVIVGPDELAEGKVVLRDMRTRAEETVTVDSLTRAF